MFTFDSHPNAGASELDQLFGALPDVIECGEGNDYWVQVRRSTRKIELVSKVTGVVVATAPADAPDALPWMNERILGAARSALKL
jgi:hypothetical protein